jgi:hypothetical protein
LTLKKKGSHYENESIEQVTAFLGLFNKNTIITVQIALEATFFASFDIEQVTAFLGYKTIGMMILVSSCMKRQAL